MTTKERGHGADPNPEEQDKTPLSFEQMFKDEPWLRGFSTEALNARTTARQTYANYLLAIEQQAADRLARERQDNGREQEQAEAGRDMSALALRKMAEDVYRGNEDPPLPQN